MNFIVLMRILYVSDHFRLKVRSIFFTSMHLIFHTINYYI